MARVIEQRIKVYGKLVAESPLHVGGIGGNFDIDLALAVNGQGRYYIPGTSLAGALRSWMWECFDQGFEQDLGKALTERLWGYQEKVKGKDANLGHASFLLVEDAFVELPTGTNVEIRDGVGIDREWGAAAEQIKYDRAIIPRGATFDLKLTVEIPKDTKDTKKGYKVSPDNFLQGLETLLATLREGDIQIGAAKTRGLGRVKLAEDYKVTKQNLLTYEGMLATLKGEEETHIPTADPCIISKLSVRVKWKPVGALMVKAEQAGIAVDIVPLMSTVEEEISLVLPGSSIKGALRSQAERIIRTVCQIPSIQQQDPKQRFLHQLNIPLVTTLFGTAAKPQGKKPQAVKGIPQLGLGALAVDDCYSTQRMNSSKWQTVLEAKDSKRLRDALDDTPLEKTQQAFHVAVDRWTGGAADGFLYSNLEPFNVSWEDICLTVNLNRISENEQTAVFALLLLTLRDLSAQRIPLGYGVNRGMGAVEVEKISLQGRGLKNTTLSDLETEELYFTAEGEIKGLDENLLATLNRGWQAWIECNHHQAGETE